MSKKKLLIGLIILLLLAGVIIAIVASGGKDKKSTNSSTTGNSHQAKTSANTFSALSTDKHSFKATISSDGNVQGSITSDGKGNISYTATTNGVTTKIIYTADAYYLCSGSSTCIKYPRSSSTASAFNPSDYLYTADKLSTYKTSSTYKGTQSCPAGSCDVWSVTNSGATSTLFVDTKTHFVSQVESTVAGKTSKVVYDYTNATVEVPAKFQTLPNQSPY
ncbi:MAG: hypothetical protein ACXWLH_01190 [Candidatus Saccharimonadales bacterium]